MGRARAMGNEKTIATLNEKHDIRLVQDEWGNVTLEWGKFPILYFDTYYLESEDVEPCINLVFDQPAEHFEEGGDPAGYVKVYKNRIIAEPEWGVSAAVWRASE